MAARRKWNFASPTGLTAFRQASSLGLESDVLPRVASRSQGRARAALGRVLPNRRVPLHHARGEEHVAVVAPAVRRLLRGPPGHRLRELQRRRRRGRWRRRRRGRRWQGLPQKRRRGNRTRPRQADAPVLAAPGLLIGTPTGLRDHVRGAAIKVPGRLHPQKQPAGHRGGEQHRAEGQKCDEPTLQPVARAVRDLLERKLPLVVADVFVPLDHVVGPEAIANVRQVRFLRRAAAEISSRVVLAAESLQPAPRARPRMLAPGDGGGGGGREPGGACGRRSGEEGAGDGAVHGQGREPVAIHGRPGWLCQSLGLDPVLPADIGEKVAETSRDAATQAVNHPLAALRA
mmetsp:Transcript_88704/g.284775  ORF Transcript_88704/g.284775 Transcript_88704/m.284775 type:complete len:345 (+) Transcript_88704:68-1102(+)